MRLLSKKIKKKKTNMIEVILTCIIKSDNADKCSRETLAKLQVVTDKRRTCF